MKSEKIKIVKKSSLKGEDGYKTFSIRVKEDIAKALDVLAEKSNRSRNELINIFLEYGINNSEII